jgi:hypothetical protein
VRVTSSSSTCVLECLIFLMSLIGCVRGSYRLSWLRVNTLEKRCGVCPPLFWLGPIFCDCFRVNVSLGNTKKEQVQRFSLPYAVTENRVEATYAPHVEGGKLSLVLTKPSGGGSGVC